LFHATIATTCRLFVRPAYGSGAGFDDEEASQGSSSKSSGGGGDTARLRAREEKLLAREKALEERERNLRSLGHTVEPPNWPFVRCFFMEIC